MVFAGTLGLGCLGVSGVAQAHIILVSDGGPNTAKDFQVMADTIGDPQKPTPCGGPSPSVPTNAVLTVHGGDTVTFNWTEAILHSGHFRIALAPVPPGEADGGTEPVDGAAAGGVLPDPGTTEGDTSEAIAVLIHPNGAAFGSGGAVVLADNLFPHCAEGDPCDAGPVTARNGTSYTTTVTIPNTPCTNCTLQLLQFMAFHGPDPSFFYHHCATVTILPAVGADGGVLPEDASVGSSGSSSAVGSGASGGGSSAGNPATGGSSSGGAGSGSNSNTGTATNGTGNDGTGVVGGSNASSSGVMPSSHNGGCGMATGAASVPAALMALSLTLARRRRARKSRPSAP